MEIYGKATPSGNTVSGQGLSQVKRRAGGFRHYVIILLSEHAGADPEVEEGEGGAGHGYRVGLVRPAARAARRFFFRELVMHSVLGRSGGMLLYKFRRYESASEAVGDHHNHAKCLTTGL